MSHSAQFGEDDNDDGQDEDAGISLNKTHNARMAGAKKTMTPLLGLCLLLLVSCATTDGGKVRVPHPDNVAAAFAQLRGPHEHKTGVVLLTDNAISWATRWELLKDAREKIDLSTFIFEDDVFGFAVLGVLAERARAGVAVRLLV